MKTVLMVDEKKLVESLRRGDAKAINAIFENYYQNYVSMLKHYYAISLMPKK
ncbi:MAG: hypothetical protein HC905_00325 [Bacteroidales bacterium]|nr:hypothetical protein [Bacteroidales bacterium]